MYFTDRGIEELGERRGEEQVSLGWLAARLTAFVDLHPEFDIRNPAPGSHPRPAGKRGPASGRRAQAAAGEPGR